MSCFLFHVFWLVVSSYVVCCCLFRDVFSCAPLGLPWRLSVARQLCLAMDALHRRLSLVKNLSKMDFKKIISQES